MVMAYSLWSFGAFALNGRAFSQDTRGAHHIQVAATHEAHGNTAHSGVMDAHHHAAGDHDAIADHSSGSDHDHLDGKTANCCGAACIPGLASDFSVFSFADRIAAPVPTQRAVDRVAEAPVLLYRPPIAL